MKEGYIKLKEAVVAHLLYKQEGLDEPYMYKGKKSFTRRQLAKEIEEETEDGIEIMANLMNLTIDMVSRGKKELE